MHINTKSNQYRFILNQSIGTANAVRDLFNPEYKEYRGVGPDPLHNPDVVATNSYRVNRCIKLLSSRMHGFIVSKHDMIDDAVHVINNQCKDIDDPVILDLGCGISPLLLLLNSFGLSNLYGVELQVKLVDLLSNMIPDQNIIQGNLMKPRNDMLNLFSRADIIYLYQPIQSDTVYDRFISLLSNIVKKGCVIMDFHGPIYRTLKDDSHFQECEPSLIGQVYKKII